MFKSGMAGMMKKAQKMQDNVQKAQEEIKLLAAVGKSDGGNVQVHINGERQATNVQIDSSLMDDKELLEDLIITAINDANQQISDISAAKIKNATGGVSLPF